MKKYHNFLVFTYPPKLERLCAFLARVECWRMMTSARIEAFFLDLLRK